MDVELRAGAHFNLASTDELEQMGNALRRDIRRQDHATPYPPIVEFVSVVQQTDGTGNIGGGYAGNGQEIFRVPLGRFALVHRVMVWDNVHLPSAPLAAGSWALFRNALGVGNAFLFPTVASPIIPFLEEDGTASAFKLTDGDRIMLAAQGLPVSSEFGMLLQLGLYDASLEVIEELTVG